MLISLIPAIGEALVWLWDRVLDLIAWLMSLLGRLSGFSLQGSPGGGEAGFELGETTEPSALALFLQKIAIAIALVLAAALLALLLWKLWRVLRILFTRFIERLRQYSQNTTSDYVDEAIDTRDAGSDTIGRHRQSRRRRKNIDLRNLGPREKIRAVYRMMISRDREWNPALTARDRLPATEASIYEEARYSSHPITGEQAEAFARSSGSNEK